MSYNTSDIREIFIVRMKQTESELFCRFAVASPGGLSAFVEFDFKASGKNIKFKRIQKAVLM